MDNARSSPVGRLKLVNLSSGAGQGIQKNGKEVRLLGQAKSKEGKGMKKRRRQEDLSTLRVGRRKARFGQLWDGSQIGSWEEKCIN